MFSELQPKHRFSFQDYFLFKRGSYDLNPCSSHYNLAFEFVLDML